MRHTIISAFVNLTAGTFLFRPGDDEAHVLGMRERVTPPGQFETHDEEQLARLIRARCLKSSDTAIKAPRGASGPETGAPVSLPVTGDAVSHAFPNPDAPSPIPTNEADAPRVHGGPSDADGRAAGISDGSTAAATGGPVEPGDPLATAIAGAGAGIQVADPDAAPAPAPVTTPAPAPAPTPVKRTASKGGADPANVARKDGGDSGDGTVSNRERRRLARAAATKRD